ncbi:MAG: transketolase C-terminal domain-containing protein [Coxiellaceae bacterium]|nr:transketolase C-terminal domain-containing protein [Coxiellaceae bacterium]
MSYGEAICEAFKYLLKNNPNVFVIGQGLWSPWYVGSTMKNLDVEFGADRVIDSPISEAACTGAAIGASLCGYRPIVVHPRMDFMLLATDQLLNEASKWSYMFGGQAHPAVTVRGIINRGGEQGAQHSQALHSLFAHIPGLRVVMPATVSDARDLLISSVLSDDPVLYIDDRWLYDLKEDLGEVIQDDLATIKPKILIEGTDISFVAAGYSVQLCMQATQVLKDDGISCEVIDLRMINPLDVSCVIKSVQKTRRLCAVDGGWKSCGLAGEIISSVLESIDTGVLLTKPLRLTLPDAPAPSSKRLEENYYLTVEKLVSAVKALIVGAKSSVEEYVAVPQD